MQVEHHTLMPAAHPTPNHIRAHSAQTNHANLHILKSSLRPNSHGSTSQLTRLQMNEFYHPRGLPQLQPRYSHRQLETPRTGAARVEKEYAGLLPANRLMRVAADHDLESGGGGVEVQLVYVV